MVDAPFDRSNIGFLERPASVDLNRAESQLDRSLRDLLQAELGGRSLTSRAAVSYSGFIGDGLRVAPSSPIALSVQVLPGFGFIYDPVSVPTDIGSPDLLGVDDLSTFKPVYLLAPATFAVPTAPGVGMSRIDIIEVRVDRRLADPLARQKLNVNTNTFQPTIFNKTLTFGLDGRTGVVSNPSSSTAGMSYKIGTPAATGTETEPATTAGYVKIGRINVGPSVTTIDDSALVDRRPILHAGGRVIYGASWRLQWNGGSPIVTTRSMDAPPGVRVGLVPITTFRGAAEVFVIGGEISRGVMTITAGPNFQNTNSDRFVVGLQQPTAAGAGVFSQIDSTLQASAATATPTLNVGIGALAFRGQIISRFVSNTGASNNTDTSLEDLLINVTGTVGYL